MEWNMTLTSIYSAWWYLEMSSTKELNEDRRDCYRKDVYRTRCQDLWLFLMVFANFWWFFTPKLDKSRHPGPASGRTGAVRREDQGRGQEGGWGPPRSAGGNTWEIHGKYPKTSDSYRFLMIFKRNIMEKRMFHDLQTPQLLMMFRGKILSVVGDHQNMAPNYRHPKNGDGLRSRRMKFGQQQWRWVDR